jgi:GNAT superfamily N-acetyltransferase
MTLVSYHDELPTVIEYLSLRDSVNFSPRSVEAAAKGLPGSLYSVTARKDGRAVGMARIVVDVIVIPELQGQGIGSELMNRLSSWMEVNVPPGGMVILTADEPGRKLYERHGFHYSAPESPGMKKYYPV